MTNRELCELFDQIEGEVRSVNCGRTTLESLVEKYDLIKGKSANYYIVPKWGWAIQFEPELGEFCMYY